MDDTVTEPWASDTDVLDLSDADLEASRSKNTAVSDASGTLHPLIAGVCLQTGLNRSQAVDRALRVGLADLLDDRVVPFDRDTFDVAYAIPPASWLTRQSFPTVELPDPEGFPEDIDPDDRLLGYSTAPVIHEMAKRASEVEDVGTISAVAVRGARILTQGPNSNQSDTSGKIAKSHKTVTEDGDELRTFKYESDSVDEVRIQLHPTEDTFEVAALQDGQTVYHNTFRLRELSFDPVSVLGRGESDRLGGVSASDGETLTEGEVGYEGVPLPVHVALNSMGFAVVPEGEGWLDV